MSDCQAPVLFIVFNRSDTALEVLSAISAARPKRVYIAADGPRPNRPEDRETTGQVRQAVLDAIDWPCEVKTLFQSQNLGCRHGVRTAIDWFFENEEEGIILEDDVVPCPEFFRVCEFALEQYRHEDRIFMVSGTNPLGAATETSEYFYSSFGSIWGWASWRRAWAHYDVEMKGWPDPKLRQSLVKKHGRASARYLCSVLDSHIKYDIDTWDSQWTYTLLKNEALAVVPSANLIRNIGIVGTHSSVEMRNHKLPYGRFVFPVNPRTTSLKDDQDFRQRMTREIFLPAMFVSEASRIAKRIGVHALLKSLYTATRRNADS